MRYKSVFLFLLVGVMCGSGLIKSSDGRSDLDYKAIYERSYYKEYYDIEIATQVELAVAAVTLETTEDIYAFFYKTGCAILAEGSDEATKETRKKVKEKTFDKNKASTYVLGIGTQLKEEAKRTDPNAALEAFRIKWIGHLTALCENKSGDWKKNIDRLVSFLFSKNQKIVSACYTNLNQLIAKGSRLPAFSEVAEYVKKRMHESSVDEAASTPTEICVATAVAAGAGAPSPVTTKVSKPTEGIVKEKTSIQPLVRSVAPASHDELFAIKLEFARELVQLQSLEKMYAYISESAAKTKDSRLLSMKEKLEKYAATHGATTALNNFRLERLDKFVELIKQSPESEAEKNRAALAELLFDPSSAISHELQIKLNQMATSKDIAATAAAVATRALHDFNCLKKGVGVAAAAVEISTPPAPIGLGASRFIAGAGGTTGIHFDLPGAEAISELSKLKSKSPEVFLELVEQKIKDGSHSDFDSAYVDETGEIAFLYIGDEIGKIGFLHKDTLADRCKSILFQLLEETSNESKREALVKAIGTIESALNPTGFIPVYIDLVQRRLLSPASQIIGLNALASIIVAPRRYQPHCDLACLRERIDHAMTAIRSENLSDQWSSCWVAKALGYIGVEDRALADECLDLALTMLNELRPLYGRRPRDEREGFSILVLCILEGTIGSLFRIAQAHDDCAMKSIQLLRHLLCNSEFKKLYFLIDALGNIAYTYGSKAKGDGEARVIFEECVSILKRFAEYDDDDHYSSARSELRRIEPFMIELR